MTSTELSLLCPLDSPLPSLPEGEVLTAAQWRTLMAIADAIIPSIEVSSAPSIRNLTVQASEYASAIERIQHFIPVPAPMDTAQSFLQEKASSTPGFRESIHRLLGHYLREDALKSIRVILSTLDAKGLASLVVATWVKNSPTLGPVLGFPKVPIHGKPGKGFNYDFIQFPPGDEPDILETDVVIVGSGCGGSVCAKNLAAEAGLRVIVVEKAYHYPPEHLPITEANAAVHLFMNGGVNVSDDKSIAIIAGQAWGGGGTVNWSASLQTQQYVRQDWANAGLPFFTSSAFQDSLDRVCQRMGVSTDHVEHGVNNQVLYEGAQKLGYSAKVVPQNTGGNKHYCGYCTLGCGSAEKQGPVVSFLPDAARAGAQFIEGFEAERVLFQNVQGKRTAVGVKGHWHSRDTNGGVNGNDKTIRSVIIKAKRVIVSCGTLQSPLLLLRSGLKNPQIGQNLHLHPVTVLGATYAHPTLPWEGPILITVITSLENPSPPSCGVKLEALTMLPSWFLPFFPWRSGLDWKLRCAAMSHSTGHIALVRDRNTGRVYPDPVDGRLRVQYTPGKHERRAALEGMCALAKIAYTMGAREIYGSVGSWPRFERAEEAPSSSTTSPSSTTTHNENQTTPQSSDINDPPFRSFLSTIRRIGLPPSDTTFGSAHQMGTCRMSSSEHGPAGEPSGVVDPNGRVWGVEGLYVADASVFPSASGVNPMVTNMAVCDMISWGVARGLKAEGEGVGVRARL